MSDIESLVQFFDEPTEYITFDPSESIDEDDITTTIKDEETEKIGSIFKSAAEVPQENLEQILKITKAFGFAEVASFPRNAGFSIFIPRHREYVSKLVNIILATNNNMELLKDMVNYLRARVNRSLFTSAYSIAWTQMDSTKGMNFPNHFQLFSYKFVDTFENRAIPAPRLAAGRPFIPAVAIDLQPTKTPRKSHDPEHRLDYWREDHGLNLHHWHWHIVYPGFVDFVKKQDRRGELFYYMHQQMIARYNFERLCNSLKRVEKLTNWTEPIKQAYFPQFEQFAPNKSFAARPENMLLKDLELPDDNLYVTLMAMQRYLHRILKAIEDGMVLGVNNEMIPLGEVDGIDVGIDVLGNMIEATISSPNNEFYGNFHNNGHNFLAYIHDPKCDHGNTPGVMSDSATAARDPVFYRWHALIDSIFQEYKLSLPSYTTKELSYDDIQISAVSTRNLDENEAKTGNEIIFKTTFQNSVAEVNGIDFTSKAKVEIVYTHLQHKSFQYEIKVDNNSINVVKGTCRIFLAPKNKELDGKWILNDQRLMFIELDKFKVTLKPGQSIITRSSEQSSVTVDFKKTFYRRDTVSTSTSFCSCGWPHHLLLPKGATEGFPCDLFVMISNYDDDKIEVEPSETSRDAESYCGVRDSKYPDRRAMGYPFDRSIKASNWNEFLTPNMMMVDCLIKHEN